jgi:DNA helicase II / ATP-dependent DNA helicase PcrA
MQIDFSELNPAQREAVETISGPLLVLAGAGTGKTRVITYRIANLLKNWIAPEHILALTFTNKAAREMRERVKELVNNECAKKIFLGTFHAFCIRVLRAEVKHTELHSGFTIADDVDQSSIFKQVMAEVGVIKADTNLHRYRISNAKNELISPSDFLNKFHHLHGNELTAKIYKKYQNTLLLQNMLDFDDILMMTVKLWENNPETLAKYQDTYRHLLVDEFQDTNYAQFKIIELLGGIRKNICVVGDDDQCVLKGTEISCVDGITKIEKLNKNKGLLCAAGHSKIIPAKAEKILTKKYKGSVVKVTTKKGKTIVATPNHIGFAKLNPEPEKYYVYLMFKKDKGYRIGQTQGVRSRNGEIVNGLKVRLNQEHADKIWILKLCDNKEKTTYFEQYFAFKYGIPTTVFHGTGRRISMSQKYLDKLFDTIDTEKAANKLMEDEILFEKYPHCTPNAVVRSGAIRRIINITSFGGRKTGNESGWHSHRISLNTSGNRLKEFASKNGFPVRNGQRSTWRVETERAEYDEADLYADKLSAINEKLTIVKKAKLVKDRKSFMYMPFAHMQKNMFIPVLEDGNIVEDVIQKVEYKKYDGFVYDLSVPHLRQYIANGVVIHNSIYGWRGAKVENILNFPDNFPGTKTIKLEQNYRSTNTILKAANSFISGNKRRHNKFLWSKNGKGPKIKLHQAETDMNESVFVTDEIYRIMMRDSSVRYKDIAVLYRSNHQSRLFEQQLRKDKIPYKLVGSRSFYERREIRDAVAYLKLIVNPRDDQSFLRIIGVPSRGLGKKAISTLRDLQTVKHAPLCLLLDNEDFLASISGKANSNTKEFYSAYNNWSEELSEPGNLAAKVRNYFSDIGFLDGFQKIYKNIDEAEARRENVTELISAIAQYEDALDKKPKLIDFLESFSLSDDNDKIDEDENNGNSVTLLTVHAAKGLEFPYIFVVGMEQGIFPHSRALEERDIDEERRLFYVAITRAKELLTLTYSKKRYKFGRQEYQCPSAFTNELPEELLETNITEEPVEDDIVGDAFSSFYDQFEL